MHDLNEYRLNSTPHMWTFIKLALFAFCTFIFKYYGGGFLQEIPANDTSPILSSEPASEVLNETSIAAEVVDSKADQSNKIPRVVIKQPSCSILDTLLILEDICLDLKISKTLCRPEDVHDPNKHKIPQIYYAKNQSSHESENNYFVNYLIAALLLTSLGAALLEFYRAKTFQHPSESERKGGKVSLNRKCSLADLTVMKHHRKELVRRESVLEQTREEGAYSTSKQGRNPCRPPMRVD